MFDLNSPQFQELLKRRFHYGTRAKGEKLYQEDKVAHCEVTELKTQCNAVAQVQGSAPLPYDVVLNYGQQGKQAFMNASCTCPMLENCKHIYAVLLAARELSAPVPDPRRVTPRLPFRPRPAPPPQLSPEWKQWLNRITKVSPGKAGEDSSEAAGSEPLRRLLYILKP